MSDHIHLTQPSLITHSIHNVVVQIFILILLLLLIPRRPGLSSVLY